METYVHHVLMGTLGGQKKTSDPQVLELHVIESCHVDAGKQT